MNLEHLVGEHILTGVTYGSVAREDWCGRQEDVTCVRFCLDGITYVAYEDPDDGYRSHCEELIVEDVVLNTIPKTHVLCTMLTDDDDVLVVTDIISGKTILEIGTLDYEDYYPCFHYEYNPENLHYNINRIIN